MSLLLAVIILPRRKARKGGVMDRLNKTYHTELASTGHHGLVHAFKSDADLHRTSEALHSILNSEESKREGEVEKMFSTEVRGPGSEAGACLASWTSDFALVCESPARWLDWDTNGCLNLQRIGESMQRPLELRQWEDLEALPPIGNEYQQGYKRVNDRLPKDRQRLHRAAEYRRGMDGQARNNNA
ncbi:hypothetical protein QJQ45_011931 [Haematococcus lacustris]|nr:hypothetical protein QJQ45_011931 [Haematococcus lacustris]